MTHTAEQGLPEAHTAEHGQSEAHTTEQRLHEAHTARTSARTKHAAGQVKRVVSRHGRRDGVDRFAAVYVGRSHVVPEPGRLCRGDPSTQRTVPPVIGRWSWARDEHWAVGVLQ